MSALVHTPSRGRTARFVAAWVRLYTAGLPDDIRHDRRDELAADLWDHEHDVATDPATLRAEILLRGLLGIPADLAWRIERSRIARAPSGAISLVLGLLAGLEAIARWLGRRGLPGVTTTAAVIGALLGTIVILTASTNNSGTPTANLVWWGAMMIVGAAAIGFGGRLIETRPRLGGALLIVGSALLALLLWPTIIAPVAAVAFSWRAIVRIRAARRSERVIASP